MSDPSRKVVGGFRVVGVAVRTSNADEVDPTKARLPALWQRFATEPAIHQLGAGGPVGVVTDYESDETGAYTSLAGVRLGDEATVPDGLSVVDVPSGEYLVFRTEGPLPACVIEGWKAVWAYFADGGRPRRAFRTDFEAYGEGHVEIGISIAEPDAAPGG